MCDLKDVLYKNVIFEDCCIWVVSLH